MKEILDGKGDVDAPLLTGYLLQASDTNPIAFTLLLRTALRLVWDKAFDEGHANAQGSGAPNLENPYK